MGSSCSHRRTPVRRCASPARPLPSPLLAAAAPTLLLLAPWCAPLTGEREAEVREAAAELAAVCAAMKDGLEPLERQVREVFHRIVRSRMEGLDSLMLNAD